MRRDASEFGATRAATEQQHRSFHPQSSSGPANRGKICRSVGRTFFSFDQFDFLP